MAEETFDKLVGVDVGRVVDGGIEYGYLEGNTGGSIGSYNGKYFGLGSIINCSI
jgi:hypothetical protein